MQQLVYLLMSNSLAVTLVVDNPLHSSLSLLVLNLHLYGGFFCLWGTFPQVLQSGRRSDSQSSGHIGCQTDASEQYLVRKMSLAFCLIDVSLMLHYQN